MIDRWGEPATLVQYTDTGTTDDQGDPVWSETTTDVTVYFESDLAGRYIMTDASGAETNVESLVWFKDTVPLSPYLANDVDRPARLRRDSDNMSFVLRYVENMQNGCKTAQAIVTE